MTATFGELLDLATAHLDAAAAQARHDPAGYLACGWQLRRLVAATARFLDDITTAFPIEIPVRDGLIWWQRAATDIHAALHLAAGSLGEDPGQQAAADGPLAGAADAMLAGRDLLKTHQVTTPAGAVTDRSEWAAVVRSPQVTRALTEQVAQWSLQLARLAEQLAEPAGPPGGRRGGRAGFARAGQWLQAAAAAAEPARASDPVSEADRAVLYAIPSAAAPPREAPRHPETAAELCHGITLSATRLQAVARGAAPYAAWAPGATAGAWRWTATAGAVASNLADVVLTLTAQRASELGIAAEPVRAAADAMSVAQAGWHALAGEWGQLTTETRFLATPATTEAGDVVLRLGRLACDDPAWTPAAGHRAGRRAAAEIAPDAAAAAGIVGAVHNLACAFACVAEADLNAVSAARRAGRLYLPTRSVAESTKTQRPYIAASLPRTEGLLEAYQAAAAASSLAAEALDCAALAIGAPSRALALARAVIPRGPESAWHVAPEPGPSWSVPAAVRTGAVEMMLRLRGVSDPFLLLRARTIDAAGHRLMEEVLASRERRPGPDPAALQAPPARADDISFPLPLGLRLAGTRQAAQQAARRDRRRTATRARPHHPG